MIKLLSSVGFRIQRMAIAQVLQEVYQALQAKGYNPVGQIVGYLMSGDPTYITSHGNARNLIRQLERDKILEELVVVTYRNRKGLAAASLLLYFIERCIPHKGLMVVMLKDLLSRINPQQAQDSEPTYRIALDIGTEYVKAVFLEQAGGASIIGVGRSQQITLIWTAGYCQYSWCCSLLPPGATQGSVVPVSSLLSRCRYCWRL